MAVAALALAALLGAPCLAAETREVSLPSGAAMAFSVRRPAGGGRRPALVIAGGLQTGAKALELVEPSVPVVLASFDYPYRGPLRFAFPRTLLDAPRIKAAVRETPDAVLAVTRAVRELPGVDARNVCVIGVSFGAPFVLRAAARDPSLSCVIIVEGFADLPGTAAHRMRQLWGRKLGPLARPLSWTASRALLRWLRPPRPEEDAAALRQGQRVLVIDAERDTLLPEASRRGLLAALKSSRASVEVVTVPGEHLLAGRSPPEQMRRLEAVVARWLRLPLR
jgi:dienelactone hydrolase